MIDTYVTSTLDDTDPLETQTLPTHPEGIVMPVVAYDVHGTPWTEEDIRRYWRRTARTKLRAAFLQDGYYAEVVDEVAMHMERSMLGGDDREPGSSPQPVPLFDVAWDGVVEGLWQASGQPQELLDLAEDETPTWPLLEAAAGGTQQARALFTDSLTHPREGIR